MSAKGCFHLQTYKKNHKNLETFKWIHAVFVVGTTVSHEAKICNACCRTCKKRGPFLHACLGCVYFGCHKHIREHTKHQKHPISLELSYGQIHCYSCNDYVYDADIDSITLQNKMQGGKFRNRLFEGKCWNTTEEENDLLNRRTKKICISAKSTVGLRGLFNLGDTCYMNSIVQALMHTPLLRDYFMTDRHKCKEAPGSCLVCEIWKLFQEFYKGVSVPLALHDLLYLIWTHAPQLAGFKQQDAHEFFICAMDVLHRHFLQTMPHHKNITDDAMKCPCIIDKIFTGALQSDVICQKCKGVSTTFDPILDFSLDLGPVRLGGRPPSSLVDCLERFTKAEYLGSTAKILCIKCKSYEESTKQLTLRTLPIVATFHLKRFQHSTQMAKISTVISFPEMLDMTPFMTRTKEESPFPEDNRYTLFAVINHIGKSMCVGHYTAFVRQQHDSWYKCDDDAITRANLKEVLDSEGYLLFYHKQLLEYE